VLVTSRHTVRIDPDRIASVLGPDADLATAQAAAKGALSANSLATLRLAKAYAERAGRR
jgi:aromatase